MLTVVLIAVLLDNKVKQAFAGSFTTIFPRKKKNMMETKSLLELIPSDYLKKGSTVKELGKVQEIFCLKSFKQFKINGNFYHEKIVSCAMTSLFKMTIAKRLISDNFKVKKNRFLVKDSYQIKRYIQAIVDGDKEQLIEGRYYKILDSDSASGLVPVDPWLLSNLRFAKTQIEEELTRRSSAKSISVA